MSIRKLERFGQSLGLVRRAGKLVWDKGEALRVNKAGPPGRGHSLSSVPRPPATLGPKLTKVGIPARELQGQGGLKAKVAVASKAGVDGGSQQEA